MINVARTYPPPASLAVEKAKRSSTNYLGKDVSMQLEKDFFGKCYLCEQKDMTAGINVEHLVSHQGNRDLMFDWDNLFWSCSHCNGIKSTSYDDILNCTNPAHDILNRLYFHTNAFPKEPIYVKKVQEDDALASRTAELLNKIYNGTTVLKKIESDNLRNKVIEEINAFRDILFDYENALDEERPELSKRIRRKLHKSSPFTAFKVCIVRQNEYLNHTFGHLIEI